jgi:uncharacterized protein (DUF736 family)
MAIEGANGATSTSPVKQEQTMATIGTFTRNEDGILQGSIKTLSPNTKVRFLPGTSDSEKAP